jgi:hypothetical protein
MRVFRDMFGFTGELPVAQAVRSVGFGKPGIAGFPEGHT